MKLNGGFHIALANDHAGVDLKMHLMQMLQDRGHEVINLGCDDSQRVDYPDYARKVCDTILEGKAERGVLICGSGIGMSMAANRLVGIRCAVVTDPYMAELSRAHNNANVLALGARVLGMDMAEKILFTWLRTPFDQGRHVGRIEKLDFM